MNTVVLAVVLGSTSAAIADIINVPGDFDTIQEAIDAAIGGDEVVVADGVYTGVGNRNINFNGKLITVRSANGDPSLCIIDCQNDGRGFFFNSGETNNAIVQGFTITNGFVFFLGQGGGMRIINSSPTVTNCIFINNTAHFEGGGLYIRSSNLTLTNCTFNGNTSLKQPGGGMYIDNSNPTVTNCTFSVNTANSVGGGMANDDSSPTMTNCIFIDNSAQFAGGAMANFSSNPTINNCTFNANSANDYAGGIYNVEESNPTLTDCMFSENNSSLGGAMYNFDSSSTVTNCTYDANYAIAGGAIFNYNSSPTIDKCTFSRNSAIGGGGMFNNEKSSPPISESVFCDNDPDHIAGPWTDEGGNQFLDECCPADLNGDGSVGTADLLELFAQWGTASAADFDGSGAVGKNDLLILFANWGPCP